MILLYIFSSRSFPKLIDIHQKMVDRFGIMKRNKNTDALEKGEEDPLPPAGGLAASMAAGGIIKLAAGVADMQPKIINRQMSTASFDMNSRQYEQVNW